MHPNRAFAWEDRGAMLDFVARHRFLHDLSSTGRCVRCTRRSSSTGPDRLRFHVARGNRAAAALDGARALVSCLGPDAYISPDWYGTPDQVPTWNYLAVEAEGPLRRLDETSCAPLLDDLSAEHEARLAPKPAWTRAKMSPGPLRGDARRRSSASS